MHTCSDQGNHSVIPFFRGGGDSGFPLEEPTETDVLLYHAVFIYVFTTGFCYIHVNKQTLTNCLNNE